MRRSPACRLVSLNVPEASTATYASSPLPRAVMAGKAQRGHQRRRCRLAHDQGAISATEISPIARQNDSQGSGFGVETHTRGLFIGNVLALPPALMPNVDL